jgi:hypothetical protein
LVGAQTCQSGGDQPVGCAAHLPIWAAHGLKPPHLTKKFKLSNDKNFAEKVQDVVGLYLNPPAKATTSTMVTSASRKRSGYIRCQADKRRETLVFTLCRYKNCGLPIAPARATIGAASTCETGGNGNVSPVW